MLSNIVNYFKEQKKNKTIQMLVGIEIIFRGIIVRDWFGISDTNKYHQINKIIIREAIKFYYQYQINQNTIYHSKEKQIEYLKKWYSNTISHVIEIREEVKKHINIHKLDINTANEEYIRNQIKNVYFFLRYQDDFKEVDIRKFLVLKTKKKEGKP